MHPLLAALIVLITAPSALAQGANQALKGATAKMEAVLKPRVFKLNRDLVTFHYEDQTAGLTLESVSQLQDHILHWGDRFFDPTISDESDMMGPGVYVSIDPAASRSFGGDDAQLFVITLKKGSAILDLLSEMKDDETRTIQEIIQTLHCSGSQTQKEVKSIDQLTPFFRNDPDPACRAVLINAIYRLGVQALDYGYSAASELKGCRDGRNSAFSIIDSASIKAEDLTLVAKSGVVGRPVQGLVRDLYSESSKDWELQMGNVYKLDQLTNLPPGLDNASAAPDPEYSKWKADHIFNCGAEWPTENLNPREEKIGEIYKNSVTDKEIQQLELSMKVAYYAKFQDTSDFDFDRLNAVEQMVYLASGLPPDMSKFGDWKKCKDAMEAEGDSDEKYRLGEMLLDETQYHPNRAHILTLADKFLNEIDLNNPYQPGMLFTGMAKEGLGPRLNILVNDLLLSAGGYVPIVTAAQAADFEFKDRSVTAANREKFKSVLTGCLGLYNDPNSKPDDIKLGPCGFRPTSH